MTNFPNLDFPNKGKYPGQSIDGEICKEPCMYRDPRCAYVYDSIGAADIAVLYLDEHGIPAKVMNQATLGGLVGLTLFSTTGISSHGMEVWVVDPAQAAKARELLTRHEEQRLEKRARAKNSTARVEAVCEECGKTSTFPVREQGTTQDCSNCGAYLDVPEVEESAW